MAKEVIIGTGGAVVELGGIPLEMPLLDAAGNPVLNAQGQPITLRAAPVRDDFSTVGPEPLTVTPKSDAPCGRCGEIHAREGLPLCICVKCSKFSRIAWCGYCIECTYERYSALAECGPEVALWLVDQMSPGFAKWKQDQRHELAKVNKMPWEQETK